MNWTDDFYTGIAVLLAVLFLHAFYSAVQIKWPESYFGSTDLAAYEVSLSPIRYLLFRILPVYITIIFAAVTVDRIGGSGRLCALGVGVIYGLCTSGRSLFNAAKYPSRLKHERTPTILIRGISLSLIVAISLVAVITKDIFATIVPPLEDISSTLWTGIIAGVLGAYIYKLSRGHSVCADDLVDRAKNDVPRSLWMLAGQVAYDSGADIDFTRSVMLAEHIQRPA